jgi:hypothetical protein
MMKILSLATVVYLLSSHYALAKNPVMPPENCGWGKVQAELKSVPGKQFTLRWECPEGYDLLPNRCCEKKGAWNLFGESSSEEDTKTADSELDNGQPQTASSEGLTIPDDNG